MRQNQTQAKQSRSLFSVRVRAAALLLLWASVGCATPGDSDPAISIEPVPEGRQRILQLETITRFNYMDRATRSSPLANWRWVSPGYFETIQQPLLTGRSFEERDRNQNSVILSQSAARAAFGSQPAVGQQIQYHKTLLTVIGVIHDARDTSLKKTPPYMVYLHYKDNPPLDPSFLVRSALPTDRIAARLRKAIWQRDPTVTIARIKTLESQVDDSLAPERFQVVVLIGFGLSALLLAMLGIYGVLSYSVASRKQEIGIRIALGANRQSIYSLTLAEAAAPVLAGLAVDWLPLIRSPRFRSVCHCVGLNPLHCICHRSFLDSGPPRHLR